MTCKEMDKGKLCTLCLSVIHDDSFELLEDYISQILDDLFMKVDLGTSGDPIICDKCATNLQDFFDFKWICLNTENIILSFKDTHANSTLELRDVYLSENKDLNINDISEEQKICRFCMKISKHEFTQLRDTKENVTIIVMLQKHIPELNLNITDELIACNSCFDSLQSFHSFITKCTDVDEKIAKDTDSEGNDVNSHIQLNEVAEFIYNADGVRRNDIYDEHKKEANISNKIKTENVFEEDKADMGIKTEEVHLKAEPSDSGSPDTAASPQSDKRVYKCEKCSFTTKRVCNLIQHERIHQRPPPELTCDLCPYKARFKSQMKRHSWKHNEPSDAKRFSCQLCKYKARFQCQIRHHMDTHHNQMPRMYKCHNCSYAAKLKTRLRVHMRVHKSPSELTMYKCTECTFQTKYKPSLQNHSIAHKSPSEVTLLECHICFYKTKSKDALRKHMLKHKLEDKDPSKVIIYKCGNCAYETKNKQCLKQHLMIHSELNF